MQVHAHAHTPHTTLTERNVSAAVLHAGELYELFETYIGQGSFCACLFHYLATFTKGICYIAQLMTLLICFPLVFYFYP